MHAGTSQYKDNDGETGRFCPPAARDVSRTETGDVAYYVYLKNGLKNKVWKKSRVLPCTVNFSRGDFSARTIENRAAQRMAGCMMLKCPNSIECCKQKKKFVLKTVGGKSNAVCVTGLWFSKRSTNLGADLRVLVSQLSERKPGCTSDF